MRQLFLIFILAVVLEAFPVMSQTPPVAKKKTQITKIHGDTLADDYFWLREKSNPEVIDYLKAENVYTDALMKPTETLQETLYNEMLGRIKETDLSVPYPKDGYLYYNRTEQGKQYPIYCRKKGSVQGKEEVLLDLNEMAQGKKFFSLDEYQVSNDGNYLAYSTDDTGFRQYRLYIKDLRTGQLLADTAERVTSVAWANDNKTLFYVTEDDTTKRADEFYRHVLGGKHELLYEEGDEAYHLDVHRTRSRSYIMLSIESATTTEYRYLAADKPSSALKLMLKRELLN